MIRPLTMIRLTLRLATTEYHHRNRGSCSKDVPWPWQLFQGVEAHRGARFCVCVKSLAPLRCRFDSGEGIGPNVCRYTSTGKLPDQTYWNHKPVDDSGKVRQSCAMRIEACPRFPRHEDPHDKTDEQGQSPEDEIKKEVGNGCNGRVGPVRERQRQQRHHDRIGEGG